MKKSLLIIALAVSLFSCNKETGASSANLKTAYVDTHKLMEDNDELKDLDSKRKVKTEVMGKELEANVNKLKMDYAGAQNEAQSKGPQWAQLKAQELQKRERELGMMQEAMGKQLQDEFGAKRDSIVEKMRNYVKEYGKKNGYDYIYGTGDAASVLYAKEGFDITDKLVKELNDKYKGSPEAKAAKEPATEEKK